jgi:hypothetical protein
MKPRGSTIARGTFTLLSLATCLGVSAPEARAQGASSATLRGTVVDTSGGALPGADVTLVSTRTSARRTATTGLAGTYAFVSLASGDYRVKVGLAGFRPWESADLHLSPGDSLDLEATLEVGAQTAEVEVKAVREMVRTDQGAREGLITAAQIQDLSIIGRGAMELLRILPGTVLDQDMETVGFGVGANYLASSSVNSSRGTQLSPVLDGSKVVDFSSNSGVMLNLNPDMVEEVKVQAGNYAAEYGAPSIQITAVTKGGSSRVHGSAYDYWRSWRLNANDRSNNYAGIPEPKSEYQYPGFNLSGPVLVPGTGFNRNRDKLFFFVGYEYQHQVIDPGTSRSVVPTLAQRSGDFSELLAGTGQNLAQPQTLTIPWGFPGAGELVPNNDFSPFIDRFGQAYMNLYPLPNYVDPENRYNYAFSTPRPLDRWQLTSRLDWNVTEATHAYVRLALESEQEKFWRGGLGGDWGDVELPSRTVSDNRSWSVAANVTSVLGPRVTNEVVVSATQLKRDNDWEDRSKVSYAALGLEGFQGIFPSESDVAPISVQPVGQMLGMAIAPGGFPLYTHTDSVTLADTLTKVTGVHTIKLGLFVERGQQQGNSVASDGWIVLGSPWMPSGTGNDFGDLLVGRPALFQQTTPSPRSEHRFWNFEGFLQDSWKVRRNLTLEPGLRISKMTNNAETNGLATRFEPSAYDYSQGPFIDGDPQRPNGVLLASRGQIPDGTFEDPGLLVMPRLNFAWDVRGDGAWTLRGGAGLFYNRPPGDVQKYSIGGPPNVFRSAPYWWDAPDGILSLSTLPTIDPWSSLGTIEMGSIGPRPLEPARTWSWSLAAARRLPWQQTLEVAYVGNRASHLLSETPMNYVLPESFAGPYGNADLDNPLHRAAFDSGLLANFRPYPAWAMQSKWTQSEGYSSYHALQATLARSAGARVQYFVNYTFGKALGTTTWGAPLDPLEPRERSYGILAQDRTHIFNASYNVLLPDPIRPDGNGFLRQLLNGWQVSGITSYRSGRPYHVHFSGELTLIPMLLAWWNTEAHWPSSYQTNAIAPVFLGDPRTGNTGVGEKVLDIDQIAIPALGESGPFQQPYDFRTPSRWNWDLTLFKDFSLGGDKRLQLRVGFFNLFNQAVADLGWWGNDIDLNLQVECNVRADGVPNGAGGYADGVCDPTQGFHFSDYSRENFGRITTKRGHRVIELALRFDF